MEDVKELVTAALDRQGVLARMKAELRCSVFLAIDQQGKASGGMGLSARKGRGLWRQELLSNAAGQQALGLVRELLASCDMACTLKVFDAELDARQPLSSRQDLAKQLVRLSSASCLQ